MPIVGQFGSLAGLGSLILPGGAMESIATVTVGSGGASSIEFTSIPGTYQHLQLRGVLRGTGTQGGGNYYNNYITFNGVTTGTSYAWHYLMGNGAAAEAYGVASTNVINSYFTTANALTSNFAAVVVDILDYASTSKATTLRQFNAFDNNNTGSSNYHKGFVTVASGLYTSTDAVTSIKMTPSFDSFAQHSQVALYGIKAP